MKELIVYTEGGLSGDMFLSALHDLGLDAKLLGAELQKLGLPGFELSFRDAKKSGIVAKQLVLEIPDEKNHRHLADIITMIESSSLSQKVKTDSVAIFRTIAEAEAKVHGIDMEKVHFHEVGALDSIIDIVGFCIGVEKLGIKRIRCNPLVFGTGYIDCAHGKMPVPVPAVLEICKGLPSRRNNEITTEWVTPTGAGIVATLADFPKTLSRKGSSLSIGYGTGTREFDIPNILRLELLETNTLSGLEFEELIEISTNVDDMNPQLYDSLITELLGIANDVWIESIQMKKNRPAQKLTVLCLEKDRDGIIKKILAATSSIGVRVKKVDRYAMEREVLEVEIEGQPIRIKKVWFEEIQKFQPEYDDCKTAAEVLNKPIREILILAQSEALNRFG